MARPFWTGQIRISLVSFGVKLFPAVESKSEIRFHQISRNTGERVRHQKVSEGDAEPVESADIVKGYEYSKGQYIQIEPSEIANLRIESREAIDIEQFVSVEDLDPALFVKPYFIVPENKGQTEAFAVVREAMKETGKVGIGKFATGGREHLLALSAPHDETQKGLLGYTLRYEEELRSATEYFAEIPDVKIDSEQLDLAKELIKRRTDKFDLEEYKDEYEKALRELVDAKLKHVELPKEKSAPKNGKVVDLMDALRKSVKSTSEKAASGKPASEKKPPKRATAETVRGIQLVEQRAKNSRRKSA